MDGKQSLTPEEVAALLNIKKNTVYEMIKRGDLKAYRVGRKLRIDLEDVEAYKKQGKGASVSEPAIPTGEGKPRARSLKDPYVSTDSLVICGQDIMLDVLTRYLEGPPYGFVALRLQVGSISGLNALYAGRADVATAHLWDGDKDEYNISYVKYLVPGIPKILVHLVSRMEGFYVAAGNPLQITTWTDLVRPDVRMVNREKGSGARVLLDEQLRIRGIDRRSIQGYGQESMSHLEVASMVACGEADVGLGIQKAALQVRGVDFIPLQKERYDMVILKDSLKDPRIEAILDIVNSREFRANIQAMGDYDVSDMGKMIDVS